MPSVRPRSAPPAAKCCCHCLPHRRLTRPMRGPTKKLSCCRRKHKEKTMQNLPWRVFEGARGIAQVFQVRGVANPAAIRWEVRFRDGRYPCSNVDEAAILAMHLTRATAESLVRPAKETQ